MENLHNKQGFCLLVRLKISSYSCIMVVFRWLFILTTPVSGTPLRMRWFWLYQPKLSHRVIKHPLSLAKLSGNIRTKSKSKCVFLSHCNLQDLIKYQTLPPCLKNCLTPLRILWWTLRNVGSWPSPLNGETQKDRIPKKSESNPGFELPNLMRGRNHC